MAYQWYQDHKDRKEDKNYEEVAELKSDIASLKADNHNYYSRSQDLLDKNLALNTELDQVMDSAFKIKRAFTRLVEDVESEGYRVGDDGRLVPDDDDIVFVEEDEDESEEDEI